jgi:uncharacterized protein
VGVGLTSRERRLRQLLDEARVVAVVGISSTPSRPSFGVGSYLQEHGYRIVPVNPNETEVLGERAYASLPDIPHDLRVDVVDVFRRPEHTPEVARQAVAIEARLLWLQEGIVNDDAARIATEGGLEVVMGVCIRHLHARLLDEDREEWTEG